MTDSPPWSREELLHAYFHRRDWLDQKLDSLPGRSIFDYLEEISLSHSIFVSSSEDLFESIHRFKLLEGRRKLYEHHSQQLVEDSVLSVQRGIFSTCSAALALVDHTRRISRKINIGGYTETVRKYFSENGLHHFIQGLRNYSSHRNIVKANWQVNYDFTSKSPTISFLIETAKLKEWEGWSTNALEFIENQGSSIDVEESIDHYSKLVFEFHQWLRYQVRKDHESSIEEYLRYRNIIEGFKKYYSINMLIGHLTETAKAHPEMYLENFLTAEQLNVVLACPNGSAERVDQIIHFFDTYGACDAQMREKLLEVFGVNDA